jgi:hypothetical protein
LCHCEERSDEAFSSLRAGGEAKAKQSLFVFSRVIARSVATKQSLEIATRPSGARNDVTRRHCEESATGGRRSNLLVFFLKEIATAALRQPRNDENEGIATATSWPRNDGFGRIATRPSGARNDGMVNGGLAMTFLYPSKLYMK